MYVAKVKYQVREESRYIPIIHGVHIHHQECFHYLSQKTHTILSYGWVHCTGRDSNLFNRGEKLGSWMLLTK